MKNEALFGMLAVAAIGWTSVPLQSSAAAQAGGSNAVSSSTRSAPALRVAVDPRVELLSLVFRLAGNQEYSRGKVESYTADAEKQFGAFREHPAIALAAELRNSSGVSFDACMGMAVHLTDAYNPQLRTPLVPWPESLDHRWTTESASKFAAAARQFVNDTKFREFIGQHRSLYQTTETRLKELLDQQAHLEWFSRFFGRSAPVAFTVIPGMLNGGCCYGPHFRPASGPEELYCVLGVWQTDAEGLPKFTSDMLDTVVHEFVHSYANPLIDRHLDQLQQPGKTLFAKVAGRMRSQAYGEAPTMLRESLVRACVVRYVRQYQGTEAAQRAVQGEIKRGFLWMQELCALLDDYEAHRDRYPTLDAFAPRLVSFFKDYARDFATKQADVAGKRPKVVSMTPPNGATDVDPRLTEIRVKFDRPMKNGSWSMCGGGDHFPSGDGRPHYDAARTTWSVPVKLKPGWDYEFWLNSDSYDSFRSEAGVPLEPVSVTFKTAGQ